MVHKNFGEDSVAIKDREVPNIEVNVFFRGDQAWCEYDEAFKCDHIRFIQESSELMSFFEQHGWIVKEGKIVRR